MKKKPSVLPFGRSSDFLLRMKFLALFMLIAVFQVNASIYSQNTRLSVDVKNASVEEILQLFEDQADFSFIYRSDLFEKAEKLSVRKKKIRIEDFLDKYVVPQGYDYNVVNQTVVIRESPKVRANENAGNQDKFVKGKVTDDSGEPLPGATITIVGTTKGVVTDVDGKYAIEASPGDKLVVTFIGMESKIVDVGNNKKIDVVLSSKSEEVDEIMVVGFGTQKKKTIVGSMSTVKPGELKVPSSNLTTALSGRVAGVISYQTSGEPGQDNAQFFIRGVTSFNLKASPLILIDGVELSTDDLARLNPDDIESFSILKDATSTAIYGARGANGVIYVTTKSGQEGRVKVSARFENSFSGATENLNIADPITYLKLHNEAVRTRDPLGILPYSQTKIDNTLAGGNPNVYPVTDWQKLLLKDHTSNQRFNFNIRGGGKVARYYVAASYTKDNGVLKVDKRNNFNNNINLQRFLLRSNIDVSLTKTTDVILRLHSTLDDYTGPLHGGTDVYNMIMKANPVRFPAYYQPDAANMHTNHILFGNDEGGRFINPYAELVRGYKDSSNSLNLIQVEVKQDLGFITEGLKFRFLGNNNRTSYFQLSRSYNPFYYRIGYYNKATDVYGLELLNEQTGTEFLQFHPDMDKKKINTVRYGEVALNYDRTFNEKHGVSGLLVGIGRQYLDGNANSLQLSLPSRNVGLSGRFTYSYDDRYFAEFNFGYNGSERFAKNSRFGFFPSIGAGWLVSNEKFWKSKVINHLKFRASYGVVGSDNIGDSRKDRFFYLSEVNLKDPNRGAQFGTNYGYGKSGVSISRYENFDITWEEATKFNFGVELNMFNSAVHVLADLFTEKRTNILQTRSSIPVQMGLQASVRSNLGEASSKGIDISIDANKYFSNDFWLSARANFTYATSNFEVYEEPDYASFGAPWKTKVGNPIPQNYGYIAERLFIDQDDVDNSPSQEFADEQVMGGDIKYKDVNGDGIISELDIVPIGKPKVPEINYGFGFSVGYKRFDLSAFFQGLGRVSFFIEADKMSPFTGPKLIGENAILQEFADSHWSEDNRDSYALWPRLSTDVVQNNVQQSTWWLRNGAFLRLKQLELGYDVLKNNTSNNRLGMEQLRFYLSGTNLFHFSKFKLWDPELKGKGMNYPLQRVINLGVQVSF
ncbi:TonB-dependent receptor [Puteibacter caeruleilacunae]|nr:TonB-dependent receptor [Puteibacter caeruleilacunae]